MKTVRLKIGDVVLRLESERARSDIKDAPAFLKYPRFIYRGRQPSQCSMRIMPKSDLPSDLLKGAKPVFTTIHPLRDKTAWQAFKKDGYFIFRQRLAARKKVMVLTPDYRKAAVYMDGGKKRFGWSCEDLIYDCIHIMLIGYYADRGGVIVHCAGIDKKKASGMIFCGRSGAGKSTIAGIWGRSSNARVFNDDRVLITAGKGGFLMHGTPWHGNFSDYSASITGSALLKKIFFIYHCRKNRITGVPAACAFRTLSSYIFAAFWDRERLAKQVVLCSQIASKVAAYRLGFRKDGSVIDCVQGLEAR